jgi:hypothetical protein
MQVPCCAGLACLCVLIAVGPSRAQKSKSFAKEMAKAQAEWCDYKTERGDLTKGAFEVLRFPTGYAFKPRYKHDPKNSKRILNADFYCNRCVEEGRLPDPGKTRLSVRLVQRDEPQVLDWIGKNLKVGRFTYIEDPSFKILIDLPALNLRKYHNRFRKAELEELHDVFPKVTKKTVVLDPHKRAHLYLIRAHRILRDFWWLAGTTNEKIIKKYKNLSGPHMGMKNKMEVFVFKRQKSFKQFLQWSTGQITGDEGICWHHHNDRAMMMAMFNGGDRDPETQNFFLHRLTHNFLDSYRAYQFKLPAWLQMGIAHWMERREAQKYNCYCFSEGTLPKYTKEWRFLPRVRKMVVSGDVQPFAQFASKIQYGDFPFEYHMVNYSLFSYLLSLGPEKFRVFFNELKSKTTAESLHAVQIRAFRKAYGITLLQFDQGWRFWVKAVYPLV